MRIQSAKAPLTIRNDELPWHFQAEGGYQHQELPKELGSGCTTLFRLDHDFSVIETHYQPIRNLIVSSRIHNAEPRMILTLALKGCSRFDGSQGNELNFKAGVSTLTAFNSSDGCRHYQADQPVAQLRFSMGKHWLERHFGEQAAGHFFKPNGMQVIGQKPISAAAMQAVQCLRDNSLEPQNGQALFRQGLAMAIVASELSDLMHDTQPQHRVPQKDRRIAESAREILQSEFANPPSLEVLCRRLGTNQFKLKQLFRHCFNTTPYGMLLDIRMDKAYRMLASGRFTVGIVAETIGYSHVSNFSSAFNKYFGFPPTHISRHAV